MTKQSHRARLLVLFSTGFGALAGAWSAPHGSKNPMELVTATLDCTGAPAPGLGTLSVEYTSLSALEDAARHAQALPQAAIAAAQPAH